MTKEEAYHYIDNLKWLKGYDNTVIGGKTVGEILDEINDLLKEQEPIKPVRNLGITRCGNCNYEIDRYDGVKYCPNCGRAVKWDE